MCDGKTRVIFRRLENDGSMCDLIALFPDADAGFGLCDSYQHVGQHSGASLSLCYELHVAEDDDPDVLDLIGELEAIGYNLDLCDIESGKYSCEDACE